MTKKQLDALKASNAARIDIINAALAAGDTLRVETAFGPHEIDSITHDFVATAYPPGTRDSFRRRSFHYHAGHLESWEKALHLVK